MGLHGEQGGELVQSSMTKLENQTQGVRRPEDQLKVILRSHLSQTFPVLHSLLPQATKRQHKKVK